MWETTIQEEGSIWEKSFDAPAGFIFDNYGASTSKYLENYVI